MSPKPGRTGGLERSVGPGSRSASSTLGQGPVGSPAGAISHTVARCPAMYATGLRKTTVRTTTAASAMSFGVIEPSSYPGDESKRHSIRNGRIFQVVSGVRPKQEVEIYPLWLRDSP